jgi:serine/threonine-protein kinase RsbW
VSDIVEISVPADSGYVSTLRLTAASLAAHCELTVDEIEDLRLAVDEACALLLPHANGGPLTGRFELAIGKLLVEVAVSGAVGADLDRSGFAWAVLGALAEDVSISSQGSRLQLSLSKRRQAPRA